MDLLTDPSGDRDDFTHHRGAPRITSPPAADSPQAYNEDEIVAIFTDIYKHFINVFYIQEELVVFPPEDTGRHVLDRRYLSEELSLSDRVISLMERLPYVDKMEEDIHKRDSIEWYPQSIMADFRNNDRARALRDPSGLSRIDPNRDYTAIDQLDLHFMRPTDLALAYPIVYGAQQVILDTEANTIRLFCFLELPSALVDGVLEVPELTDHYRNFPAYHAPAVLRTYLNDLVSLRCLPIGCVHYISYTYEVSVTHLPMHMQYNSLTARYAKSAAAYICARIMMRYFGWPNDYRREAWGQVVRRVEDVALEVGEEWEDAIPNHQEYCTKEQLEMGVEEVAAKIGLTELRPPES